MTNLQISYEGNEIIIRAKLDEEHGPTKSGSSIRVAASDGNLTLWRDGEPTGLVLNLNLYRKATAEERAEIRSQRFSVL